MINAIFYYCYIAIFSCCMAGKPPCYHAGDPVLIPCGSQNKRSPYIHAVDKWVKNKTGANSGSYTMRVAPINHHWCYDRRLSTYNPELAGFFRVDSFSGIYIQVCAVSLVSWYILLNYTLTFAASISIVLSKTVWFFFADAISEWSTIFKYYVFIVIICISTLGCCVWDWYCSTHKYICITIIIY